MHYYSVFVVNIFSFQSDSSDKDPGTTLSEILYRHGDDQWGGPGHIHPLTDDGGPPGPGEAEEEERLDEVVRRKVLLMEETLYRKIKRGGAGNGN